MGEKLKTVEALQERDAIEKEGTRLDELHEKLIARRRELAERCPHTRATPLYDSAGDEGVRWYCSICGRTLPRSPHPEDELKALEDRRVALENAVVKLTDRIEELKRTT